MTSAIELFEEERRRAVTGDNLFYRRMPPVFELEVPTRYGVGGSYLFPLPMPPQETTVEWPFSVEITPTLGGGVVAEQSGVVTVNIMVRGTMGQRPKKYTGSYFGSIRPPRRALSVHPAVERTTPGQRISGHRFLLYLKHAVFGMYSDLKADDEASEETRLIFHNPKDDEHYVVEPRSFSIPRNLRGKVGPWNYEISMVGVELAKAVHLPTEDRGLLAKMLDTVASVRSAIRLGQAAIRDLNTIRGEIERVARNVAGAIDDIAGIFEEMTSFVDNTRRAVTTAKARLLGAVQRLEEAVESVGDALGDDVVHLLNEVQDAAGELLARPEVFEPDQRETTTQAFQRGLGLLGTRSRAVLEAASSADPPRTSGELRNAGTLPGDLVRDDRARELPEELRAYRSAFEVDVDDGDTLESIAGRHLGDARRWRHVAIINALSYPYISRDGLPNTLRPGDRVLVPSTQAPARRGSNPAVFGAQPGDPVAVRELGVDWLVERDPGTGLEDWVIDVEGGSTDLRVAEGVDCLAQDLVARLETERGSDPLYRTLGVRRVIGYGAPDAEAEAIRLRVAEALEADPRVVQAVGVQVSSPTPDTVAVEARVLVRGLRDPLTVQASTAAPTGP